MPWPLNCTVRYLCGSADFIFTLSWLPMQNMVGCVVLARLFVWAVFLCNRMLANALALSVTGIISSSEW